MNNCILWGNSAGDKGGEIYIYDSGSSCTLNYCCVDSAGFGGQTGNITENNCIHQEPQFVDAAGGDYHLKDTSPCIDAGDDSLVPSGISNDLDGNQRIVDGDNDGTATVDIGAYEYQLSLQITTTALPDGEEGVAYPTTTLNATGGTPPYAWSISGLPTGLTWTQVGNTVQISGTPASSTAGIYTVEITATDSSSPTQSASVTLQLIINSGGLVGDWYVHGINGDDSNSGTSWKEAFRTIAKALSVAADGDTILVADAIYYETDLNFNGKKVHLKGVDYCPGGLTRPVIDCQQAGKAFNFDSGETKDSVVDNFVIEDGWSGYGGAISCGSSSSPTIMNCIFINNGSWSGGAIYSSGEPTIINCAFINNSAMYGGAICWESGKPTIINCTFSGNSASHDASAIYCSNFGQGAIYNCIFWGNKAGFLDIAWHSSYSGTMYNCCIDKSGVGGANAGNLRMKNCIHDDPQFVDPAGGDYHLKDTSPCIDAGDNSLLPAGVTEDLDGNQRIADGDNDGTATVDIGAYEYQP